MVAARRREARGSEGARRRYAARLSKHSAYPAAAFVNGGPGAWLDHQSVKVKLAPEAYAPEAYAPNLVPVTHYPGGRSVS
jgi:hypothetical protein